MAEPGKTGPGKAGPARPLAPGAAALRAEALGARLPPLVVAADRVALAGPAAAMDALQHGGGDAVGGDHQRRQPGAQRLGAQRRGAGRRPR